jgi:general secretion pathway protein N
LKHLRKILLGIGLLLLAALLLVWFLPARWLVPQIEAKLKGMRFEQVQGSVWNGNADRVIGADGHLAGKLHWQLSRLALLGKIRAQWQFDGSNLSSSGAMQRLPNDQIAVSDMVMHIKLQQIDRHADTLLGQPRGELQLHITQALLQGGWPLQMLASGEWHDAVMQTSRGLVPLGELSGDAQAQAGVVQATLHDDGHGPLQVDAKLQLIPLGWRLDANLHARDNNPALQQWLHQLGPTDSNGNVHVQRSGGMASSTQAQVASPSSTEGP